MYTNNILMWSPFFRELVPRRWVTGTQSFETTLWSHLQGSKCRIRMSGTIMWWRGATHWKGGGPNRTAKNAYELECFD